MVQCVRGPFVRGFIEIEDCNNGKFNLEKDPILIDGKPLSQSEATKKLRALGIELSKMNGKPTALFNDHVHALQAAEKAAQNGDVAVVKRRIDEWQYLSRELKVPFDIKRASAILKKAHDVAYQNEVQSLKHPALSGGDMVNPYPEPLRAQGDVRSFDESIAKLFDVVPSTPYSFNLGSIDQWLKIVKGLAERADTHEHFQILNELLDLGKKHYSAFAELHEAYETVYFELLKGCEGPLTLENAKSFLKERMGLTALNTAAANTKFRGVYEERIAMLAGAIFDEEQLGAFVEKYGDAWNTVIKP